MRKLTEKDYRILDFIYEQTELNGYPPSVREICAAVGLSSTATVQFRLNKLEEFGCIARDQNKKRSLRLVNYTPRGCGEEPEVIIPEPQEEKYLEVPVLGKITAGMPITAIQEQSEVFPLPMEFAKNKDLFMLRVRGDSMINAAILDGDYIIVQSQPNASNGDIVVALIDGTDATVKTFYREEDHFRLQPENPDYEPIIVKELTILGLVVGVFRKL